MTMQDVPLTPAIAHYRVGTTLENTPYLFDVRWNAHEFAWYFDMLDENAVPIVEGIKIVVGMYLGRQCTHPFFRDGALIAIDTEGNDRDPGFDDLGTRVILRRFQRWELIGDGFKPVVQE